jgi:DNA-binding CsgD family transcriptional regulator
MGAILMKPMDVEVLKEQRTGQVQFSDKQWTIICRLLDLSEREEFVCRLLCDGHTRAAIAKTMDVTTRTVRHHMERIHRKLDVRNRVGVVLRLIQVRDTIGALVNPLDSAHEQPTYTPMTPPQN